MKSIFEKYLTVKQSDNLIEYVDNQLKKDILKFEEAFGYKGNAALIKWLLLYFIFDRKEINFTKDDSQGQSTIPDILIKKDFYRLIKTSDVPPIHDIGNHGFNGFISYFTSFFNLAGDGMGNFFFTNFVEKNSDIIFYDHENASDSYQVATMDQLINDQPIKSLDNLIELIITEHRADLGLDDLNYKEDFKTHNENFLGGDIFQFMLLLQGNNPIKELSEEGNQNSPSFVNEKELSSLLTNKESDYHKYGNVRAKYNPIIIANFYWHYLTGNFESLTRLLEETKKMKGQYYLSIRDSFFILSKNNLIRLKFPYHELLQLRKGIEIPNSKLLTYEREYFKGSILEIEAKQIEDLKLKTLHEEDNYFILGTGVDGWNLQPEIRSYVQERPLNGFEDWKNPVPIICSLKHHHKSKGAPKILADVLIWQFSVGTPNLVISEKLKNTLLEYNLPTHKFYDIQVKSYGKTYLYHAFLPSIKPSDSNYIDFGQTVFYQKNKRDAKLSILDDIKFSDHDEFTKANVNNMGTGFELKFKNNTIFLNKSLDIFLNRTLFFVSNRLKKVFEKNNYTGFSFLTVDELKNITPFSNIILPKPSKKINQPSNTNTIIEQSTLDNTELPKDFQPKNINTFVEGSTLDRSKIPTEIQKRIFDEFSFDDQELMLLTAQKVLAKSWNLSSQQLLESLLYLAKGKIESIDNFFPIYDPRDIVMMAQVQRNKDES